MRANIARTAVRHQQKPAKTKGPDAQPEFLEIVMRIVKEDREFLEQIGRI